MASSAEISPEKCRYVAGVLKNLAHPGRLTLLCLLAEKARSVSELTELSDSSQSSVSQYLKQMKTQELLTSDRKGQRVLYSIKDPKVLKLISALHDIYC